MNKWLKICSIMGVLALLLWQIAAPGPAQAQWPPFTFRLTPSYEGSRITYRITRLDSEVDWRVSDVQIKIPLPEGLRFVEAVASPLGRADFDGREVTFFFLGLDKEVRDAYFVVEVTASSQTVFTLQPWLSWQGQLSGSYLPEPITVDISQPAQSVNWQEPARLPLQLKADATVTNSVITYKIYPQRIRQDRIWDLKISLPLPEGTILLSTEAPPIFETNFDGREVYFFTVEPPSKIEPLIVNISTEGVITPLLTTRAWANWKNVSRWNVATVGAESQTVTGDIVVQPGTPQYVVADQAGDVPFGDYDLTSVSFQSSETMLQVNFHVAGQICGSQQPLEFRLFIDADCRADTGEARGGFGADYDIRYNWVQDQVRVGVWDAVTSRWPPVEAVVNHFVGRQVVAVQVPYSALGNNRQFCWAARGRNESDLFGASLPDDWFPDSDEARLTPYQPVTPTLASPVSLANQAVVGTEPWAACAVGQPALPSTPVNTASSETIPVPLYSSSEIAVPLYSKGKIAVPLYSSGEGYNIHLFSVPEGQEIGRIANARQPSFWADGQRLLFRRPAENGGIYEYNFAEGTEKLVSDRRHHQHPFYDPWGSRLVYNNQNLVFGIRDNFHPSLLVQCSLIPPAMETEPACRDILRSGVLLAAGPAGAIQGSHPVWTLTDMIAYTGCNTEAGVSQCGIYTIPATSTQRFSDGSSPKPLTDHPTDIPSDTKGGLIALTSQRDGNWEAYIMNLDGSGLRNRSTGSLSKDGLPVISPDGYWVAFVSNRGGWWAVWATPVEGGETQKLFDLPAGRQVGMNDQDWLNERLSWGP